ncbi:MAG: sugar ABC transporter ATP-binding protein [Chloroflexi bacterium]|nr:MAG: sugar ABC transporter ATP-binding protein [Chloroflexota bacterium]
MAAEKTASGEFDLRSNVRARAAPPLWRTRRGQALINAIIAYILLVAGAVIILIPFFWMVSTALKPNYQVFMFPPQWIPNPIQWDNFRLAVTTLPFHIYFKNTMTIEVGVILGTLISCTVVAYGFARLDAPGKHFWFIVLLSTMMLPGVVTLIPQYILFSKLGWVNTLLPLIVPAWFGSAFNIFLLRQFFMTIPVDLEEAARIDGAVIWQILFYIMIPLAQPALATITIFTFMGVWNDFLGPLIYLNRPETYTMALGLNFFKGQYTSDWNLLMAGSLVMMAPLLILFFVAQRAFIEGITLTGMKG